LLPNELNREWTILFRKKCMPAEYAGAKTNTAFDLLSDVLPFGRTLAATPSPSFISIPKAAPVRDTIRRHTGQPGVEPPFAPRTSGFKIVFETMVRARGTLRVREIPIVFRERVHGKSKMSFAVALRFFFRWLHAMFEHLASARRGKSASLAGATEALHPEAPGK
jgi:hypothetical protein